MTILDEIGKLFNRPVKNEEEAIEVIKGQLAEPKEKPEAEAVPAKAPEPAPAKGEQMMASSMETLTTRIDTMLGAYQNEVAAKEKLEAELGEVKAELASFKEEAGKVTKQITNLKKNTAIKAAIEYAADHEEQMMADIKEETMKELLDQAY